MDDLSQLYICAQPLSEKDEKFLNKISDDSPQEQLGLKAAYFKNKLFRQGSTINIGFMSNPPPKLQRTPSTRTVDANGSPILYDPLQKKVEKMDIKEAIQLIVKERIQPMVNLKLVFNKNIRQCQIRITFDPKSGAWSYVGTDSLNMPPQKQTMNLGWFDVATTMHEFMHAIGFVHEHQSPYGKGIDWNLPELYKWAKTSQGWSDSQTNAQIVKRYKTTEVNGSDFDPLSVMLYFYPSKLTKDNKGTTMNLRLSKTDIKYANTIYPVKGFDVDTFYNSIYGDGASHSITENFELPNNVKIILIVVSIIIALILLYFLFLKLSKKPRYT